MRAVVLHDVLRSACQAGHHQVAEVWSRLLAPALTPLGYAVSCPGAFAADRPEPVEALLRRLGLQPGPKSWARLHADPMLVPAVETLLDHVDADLVIGWELSPNLLRALGQRGVAVIDMSLAPLRFAAELYLRLRTNRAEWAARLAALAVPPAVFERAARDLGEALSPRARGETGPGGRPAVLFVGQTDLDASLIADGEVASVADHLPAVRALLAEGQALLLKPHPHGERHADIRRLHAAFPEARVVRDSVYGLLCDPSVGTVVALSSSVAEEAAWFGRRAVRLLAPEDGPGAVPMMSEHHIVSGQVATAGFWRCLLRGAGPPAVGADGISLRGLFRLSWGWPPLPPMPLPVLTPGSRLAMGRGGAGQAGCVFGWRTPDEEGTRSAGALATLAFRRAGEAVLTVALRATPRGSGGPLAIRYALRPGGALREVSVPEGEGTVVSVPLPPARGIGEVVELSFRLPEGEEDALEVVAVEVR